MLSGVLTVADAIPPSMADPRVSVKLFRHGFVWQYLQWGSNRTQSMEHQRPRRASASMSVWISV